MTFIIFEFESYFRKSMSLFDRPKSNQKGATEPMVPGPSFIHPRFLHLCRPPWQSFCQSYDPSEADRYDRSIHQSVTVSFLGAGCQTMN
jgi:hypothetical protein